MSDNQQPHADAGSAEVTPAALRVVGLRKSYGGVRALDGVDFDLQGQEIHALVGDNGAGKSTFIKILAGAISADAGRVEIDGREVRLGSPQEARDAGIETVYQDLAIADPLEAAENIYLGRETVRRGLLGRLGVLDRPSMRRACAEQLQDLGIKLPSPRAAVETLSGGQRQAVAVARAAVWGTRFLVMDEPVAALGHMQTIQVLEMIRVARDQKKLSIILISHNLPEVIRVADRITVLRLGSTALTVSGPAASTDLLIAAMTGSLAPSQARS